MKRLSSSHYSLRRRLQGRWYWNRCRIRRSMTTWPAHSGMVQVISFCRAHLQPPPIGTTGEQGQPRRTLLAFLRGRCGSGRVRNNLGDTELTVTQVPSSMPPTEVSVHRLVAAWGEGTSDASAGEGAGIFPSPGDATWGERFLVRRDIQMGNAGWRFCAQP